MIFGAAMIGHKSRRITAGHCLYALLGLRIAWPADNDGGGRLVAAADDWVVRTAGQVRAEGESRYPGETPTCASGISPSGRVHLGNLRELMVPHLVADEVVHELGRSLVGNDHRLDAGGGLEQLGGKIAPGAHR